MFGKRLPHLRDDSVMCGQAFFKFDPQLLGQICSCFNLAVTQVYLVLQIEPDLLNLIQSTRRSPNHIKLLAHFPLNLPFKLLQLIFQVTHILNTLREVQLLMMHIIILNPYV